MKNKLFWFTIICLIGFVFTFPFIHLNLNLKSDELLDNSYTENTENKILPTLRPTDEPKEVKLLFVGDVMLSRTIGERIENGEDPFINVKETFKEYDLVIANLECVISDIGTAQPKSFTFRAPIKSLDLLKDAGVDVVSLANNHTGDYGPEAFEDMLAKLDVHNLMYFGGGSDKTAAFAPLSINLYGNSISFIGANNIETYINAVGDDKAGGAYFDEDLLSDSLMKANKESEIVIPYLHWGEEFVFEHNTIQRNWAEFFIDNNSDIVIGTHPHVVQDNDTYEDREIYYSLGNFVFDNMYLGAAEGQMLEIIIKDNNIKSTKLIDIQLDDKGYPSLSGSSN
jgi:poly-gamma-glutamate synthesis protein (capsule biosynthesis protein)